MNRRSFIATLAALPIVGRIVPQVVTPVVDTEVLAEVFTPVTWTLRRLESDIGTFYCWTVNDGCFAECELVSTHGSGSGRLTHSPEEHKPGV